MDNGSMSRFSPAVRDWFLGAFDGPTAVQEEAWGRIASGENVLVVAPTGSGKTLAAFLFAIDRLFQEKALRAAEEPPAGKRRRKNKGVKTLYISPLKALGADVERNLQRPLREIAAGKVLRCAQDDEGGVLRRDEGALPEITVAQRTGDTTPEQRRKLVSNPPDILITTPESLYLMLTSQAREILRTVETVIVDEVHALAGNKRGAHLSLSLERLDALLPAPAQRVGLSATVQPVDEVARFLGGVHPVAVVQAESRPQLDIHVSVPVPDMTAIPTFGGTALGKAHRSSEKSFGPRRAPAEVAWKSDRALRSLMANDALPASPDTKVGNSTIWPYLESDILDLVLTHRSTIVFVNSRGLCEKLTARLNELYARRFGGKTVEFVDAGYWSAVGSADTAGERTAGAGGEERSGEFGEEEGYPQAYRSDIGASTKLVEGAPEVVAKAHHGSVSKEKRRDVEEALKIGQLPCVVATSSLELGIDMGDVDLVIQVAPPPSVASGLQRIGRANHQVGGCSMGVFLPRTRNEVVDMAVVAEGMREGRLEATRLVANALDVLAQQTVAAVAMESRTADDWFQEVRRSANYADLPRSAFDNVLAMLAGEYTEGILAKVPARLSWDRETGQLTAKPGAQRAAVGAAGTIPDRGMFPVVLPQGDGAKGRKRVGELDEEMVMESRVGDVITLGTSTWKIREITVDRVMVEPAPGRSSRLPFWHGEAPSRPFEAGQAKGAFVREVGTLLNATKPAATGTSSSVILSVAKDLSAPNVISTEAAKPRSGEIFTTPEASSGAEKISPLRPSASGRDDESESLLAQRLERDGLDAFARDNLLAVLEAQREATGVLPSDKQLVAERCEDETGDWRLILHSPFGRAVHEPWALAVSARIKALYHFNAQVMAGDDGLVVQWPASEGDIPGGDLFRFSADEALALVRSSLEQTALFAARFRECAARALLMPSAPAGKRAPLWLQRLKGGQLLEAARQEHNFPMVVEAMRECLQDVFDVKAFSWLMDSLEAGDIAIAEARTAVPSPFASSLVFGYMAEHLYEGDLPHAEQASSLLSVDPALLGELLGVTDVGHLLDPSVVAGMEAQLQRTAPGWQRKGAEGAEALLRELGPLTEEDLALRLEAEGQPPSPSRPEAEGRSGEIFSAGKIFRLRASRSAQDDEGGASAAGVSTLLDQLLFQHRAFALEMGGARRWAFVADGPRLAVVLGADVPSWARAAAGGSAGDHPLDALARRYAATHGPFSAEQLARYLGLGPQFVEESLRRLQAAGNLVPLQFGNPPEVMWVDSAVLQRLCRLSAQALEQMAAPVSAARFQQFVLERQEVGTNLLPHEPLDAVAEVIAQFEGVYLPFEIWDKVAFPARVSGWSPALLEQLIGDGEVLWVARSSDEGAGLSVAFYPTDSPLTPMPISGGTASPFSSSRPSEASGEIFATPATLSGVGKISPLRPSASGRDDVEAGVIRILSTVGPLAFPQLLELLRAQQPEARLSSTDVAKVIDVLVGEGRLTNERLSYFSCDRSAKGTARAGSTSAPMAAAGRRTTSRRGRRAMERQFKADFMARRAAEESFDQAYGGAWTLLEPAAADPTLQALGLVEGLLDRYGVVTADIALAAGIPGGLGDLYPVLRSMEDAGEVSRGRFVEGLGPVQFAARSTVEQLRADGTDESGDSCESDGALQVLPVEDPALLYGDILPWPVGGKPQKRPGSLVVLRGGAPVLFAAPRCKSLILFSTDEPTLVAAVQELCACETARLRREGLLSRAKFLVETVNGESALDGEAAALLAKAGFVRQPDGMRFYPQLF